MCFGHAPRGKRHATCCVTTSRALLARFARDTTNNTTMYAREAAASPGNRSTPGDRQDGPGSSAEVLQSQQLRRRCRHHRGTKMGAASNIIAPSTLTLTPSCLEWRCADPLHPLPALSGRQPKQHKDQNAKRPCRMHAFAASACPTLPCTSSACNSPTDTADTAAPPRPAVTPPQPPRPCSDREIQIYQVWHSRRGPGKSSPASHARKHSRGGAIDPGGRG